MVGVREMDGITTNADGTVNIPEETLSEIKRFDEGTLATVKVLGQNETGGVNAAVREVWLDKDVPWWTIWLLAAVALLGLLVRFVLRRRWNRVAQIGLSGAVLVATLPALVLGWTTASYEVLWIGLAGGVLSQALIWVLNFWRDSSGGHSQ